MRSSTNGDEGFTLVELLVSLALFSLAAVLIADSISSDRRVLGRLETLASSGETIAATQDLIRARIERLFPEASFVGDAPTVNMEGASDHLEFLASGTDLKTPIQRYRLGLRPNGDMELASVDSQGGGGASGSVLLGGVKDLEISYYGISRSSRTRSWVSNWTQGQGPPELVRIRVDFANGDKRFWPELIIRPGDTVDTACVLDEETGACRGRS